MLEKSAALWANLIVVTLFAFGTSAAQNTNTQAISGTLVVAVPVNEGIVTCSDKRGFNDQAGSFTDDLTKIRKVNNTALFVATNTIGFLSKATGKLEFDVFAITERYVSKNAFVAEPRFWDGLKKEIRKQLLEYLARQKFADWPETDRDNNKLLFNLVFFSIAEKVARSYSLRVLYEKTSTPVIEIPGVVSEQVKTPKLIGKGKAVIDYLARNPSVAQDPSILRFDEANFDIQKITTPDVVNFAKKLFLLTSTAIPQARVSSTYDCALLSHQRGFQWIDDSGRQLQKPARH
jgi:hypothetical protein